MIKGNLKVAILLHDKGSNIATFIMLFHYFFTLYLSLVYTVNHFYVFPVLQKSVTKRSRSDVKFSLYLKKAGLASRNIVRT